MRWTCVVSRYAIASWILDIVMSSSFAWDMMEAQHMHLDRQPMLSSPHNTCGWDRLHTNDCSTHSTVLDHALAQCASNRDW